MFLCLCWESLPVTVPEVFLPVMNWSMSLATLPKLFFRTSSMRGD